MSTPEPEPTEDAVGKTIRVCHAKAKITDANAQSYTAEVKLGGVIQNVVLSTPYVHDRVEVGGA